MSAFSQDVWNYISNHPGFRASQIVDGVKAHYPDQSRSYTNSTLQRLKLSGLVMTKEHPSSTANKKIGAYYVTDTYDEERFTRWQKQYMDEMGRSKPTKTKTAKVRPTAKVAPTKALLVDHTFMLRPGCFVKLQLPEDLNEQDSERLFNFLESLIFE